MNMLIDFRKIESLHFDSKIFKSKSNDIDL